MTRNEARDGPETTLMAWHFVGATLRDGRPIPPDGEILKQEGRIVPCSNGLHGSVRLLDALRYAPATTLCRVRLGGTIREHDGDKHAASQRTILWRIDALGIVQKFARQCALDVIHLWDALPVVREFLETGDVKLAADAKEAAAAAACAATRVLYAAATTTRAPYIAGRAAIRAAARAVDAAAYAIAAATYTAVDAAGARAADAASYAADAASYAVTRTGAAVDAASYAAAQAKQNERLMAMVDESVPRAWATRSIAKAEGKRG